MKLDTSKMKFEFVIICVDTTSNVKVKNETNFLHLLLSNGELWDDAELKNKKFKKKTIRLSAK